MMSMNDLVAIGVKTPRINNVCSLEKDFIKLIFMNPLMVLYQTINRVDSYYSCVHGPYCVMRSISLSKYQS